MGNFLGMVARGRKAIIRRINGKLAPVGKAVVKAPGKGAHATGREYQSLDCQQGTKHYLSLTEVWHIAKELGVLAIWPAKNQV